MESLTLSSSQTTASYQVEVLKLDWQGQVIKVIVKSVDDGHLVTCSYTGQTALTLMNQLNTLNLTTNSLHHRILDRLVLDGKLPAGTVTGTPD